jgi:hypothetical protein
MPASLWHSPHFASSLLSAHDFIRSLGISATIFPGGSSSQFARSTESEGEILGVIAHRAGSIS